MIDATPARVSHLIRFQVIVPVERITEESLLSLIGSEGICPETEGTIERVMDALPRHAHAEDSRLLLGPLAAAGVDVLGFDRGKRVRIPKGVAVRTTGPVAQTTETRRAQIITVHNAFAGHFMHDHLREAVVQWAGSGGYWKQAALNDILVNGGGPV
ncbi:MULTISPECIES: hypothetical protein [unclassified Thioalkalivibrio]|uniref:hypothetical protein n=1 Tax=unclassified Thioalkalivibrio TaxID=2621013 RepID=UPI00037B05E2|nr:MULTISPECIES: hypothetical protein [unclassified Thioalkalivibrio]